MYVILIGLHPNYIPVVSSACFEDKFLYTVAHSTIQKRLSVLRDKYYVRHQKILVMPSVLVAAFAIVVAHIPFLSIHIVL